MPFRVYIIFLVLILASCGKKGGGRIKIGFSQCIAEDIWRQEMNHSKQVEADLYPEVELEIAIANSNIQQQIVQIEKIIDDNVDVLFVSPLESIQIVPVIKKAFDNGIPVILIDRKMKSDRYTAFLGADNLNIGRIAANYIASNTQGPTRVIELMPGDDSSPTLDTSLGFKSLFKNPAS